MELDVTRIRKPPVRDFPGRTTLGVGHERINGGVSSHDITHAGDEPRTTAETYLKEILNITETFNKKLKFIVDKELGQVVVKVLDRNTDKVIKEIPPEELRNLHVRIKEALGQIIDEKI